MRCQQLMVMLFAVALVSGATPVLAGSKSQPSESGGAGTSGIDCTRGAACPIIWSPPRR